jgi:hypothetical protein
MSDEFTVKALLRLGRAQEKLDSMMKEDFFDDLSKHNPYWHSDIDGDKLDQARRRLSMIQDRLWDIISIVHGGEDDE